MTAFTIILQAGADADPMEASAATLIAQTFEDFELLVVHDALRPIRFSLQDPRITHLHPGAGLSRGECLNVALEVARGEAVVVASTHDHFRPSFLGRIHEALSTSGPHIAAIGSGPADLASERFTSDGGGPSHDQQPDLSDPENWVWRNPLHSGVAVRRQVFDTLDGFTEDLESLVELDLWIRMIASGLGFHVLADSLVDREPTGRQRADSGRVLLADYSLISQRHFHPYLVQIARTDLLAVNIEGFLSHPIFQGGGDLADIVVDRVLMDLDPPTVTAIMRQLGTTLGNLRRQTAMAANREVEIDRLTLDCQQRSDQLRQSQFDLQAALDRLGSAELDRRLAQDELARWQASMIYRAARKAKGKLGR